ncbi:MAE_28990/MAE_18760 family HEPN-like nuclease [Pseudomonas sp. Leaf129]|uniref:MAE_28990/MAE_18760 family HEPN-like nuclease n=1 Tax=Pseudomonas sp. Leaf129 TaxID=1736268 RepID=UPI000AA8CA06|nr:HEPN domain-containing protein [Pseudomonas sp. Leaf129]
MPTPLRLQFQSFSESAKPIGRLMDDIELDAARVLKDSAVRAKHIAVRSASLVLLSGLLESFLRQAAEVFFQELARRGLTYYELPPEMHKIHFVNGLSLAQKAADQKEEVSNAFSETRQALVRLAEPPSKGMPTLIWEAFAVTKGNPGPKVIGDYMRAFGIKDGLRKIAEESKQDSNLLNTHLVSFILLRNECAHTGTSKNPPLPSDVKVYVDILRRTTLGISKALDRRINELYAAAVQARVVV